MITNEYGNNKVLNMHTDPLQQQYDHWRAGYDAYMAGVALDTMPCRDARDGWLAAYNGDRACDIADTAALLGDDIDAALAQYYEPAIEDDYDWLRQPFR